MSNVRSDWVPLIWTIHAELVVRLFSEDRECDSSVSAPTLGCNSANYLLKFTTCLDFIYDCNWVNMTSTTTSTNIV
jgi:hypothetical protein